MHLSAGANWFVTGSKGGCKCKSGSLGAAIYQLQAVSGCPSRPGSANVEYASNTIATVAIINEKDDNLRRRTSPCWKYITNSLTPHLG